MNIYKQPLTDYQLQCIDTGRTQLLTLWNTVPFTDNQHSSFVVVLAREELDSLGSIDVFVARNKNIHKELAKEWTRFCDANGLAIRHDKRDFYIDVPQSYYLANTRWKMQTSRACLQDSISVFIVAGALVCIAYKLFAM